MMDIEEVPVSPCALEPVLEVRVRPEVEVRLNAANPWPSLRLITDEVTALEVPVGLPLQKADFGVEAVADLRVAEVSAPQLVGVVVVHAAGVVRAPLALR